MEETILLEDVGKYAEASQAYRYGVDLGRKSESGAGYEAAAKSAFGLGLLLSRDDNHDSAKVSYRIAEELGKLSNTSEGFEAAQKASYNNNLLLRDQDN
mgnify:FL=1